MCRAFALPLPQLTHPSSIGPVFSCVQAGHFHGAQLAIGGPSYVWEPPTIPIYRVAFWSVSWFAQRHPPRIGSLSA
jgi:hypothetical protein